MVLNLQFFGNGSSGSGNDLGNGSAPGIDPRN